MNVGAAEVDITPDFEVELCGFAMRTQPATGVLEPIRARSVHLENGAGSRLLWVTADVLALDGQLVYEFREWARRELGLSPEQVMLTATHTHSAPAAVLLNAAGRRSERWIALLSERLRELARASLAELKPCEVVAAKGRCELAIDRRNQPSRHVDHTVWSLGFREAGGGPFVATILNYAMHPVALGHKERRISPDWCGGAARSLAHALADGVATPPIVLVTNGAAGNLNPPFHNASPEQVDAWGASVAEAVAESLRTAVPHGDAAFSVRSTVVQMPLEWQHVDQVDAVADRTIRELAPNTGWPQPLTDAVTTWRDTLKTVVASGGGRHQEIEIQVARIGDVVVTAINGELFSRLTDDLRRMTGNERLFVVGYANAAFGYIPTREAYAEGGYEVDTAHFFYNSFRPLPGGLEMIAQRAAELVLSLESWGTRS